MTGGAPPVARAIASRRSLRHFDARRVDPAVIRELVALACMAPAPHHSRPWRYVLVATPESRVRLADTMTDAWRADLVEEDRPVLQIARTLERSRRQIENAPVLLVACICLDEARPWPDPARRLSERDMFVQSLGASLQNLLLAAGERGLAGYLKGAPLFCQQAVREALALPPDWEPAFLVLLGYPQPGVEPPSRAGVQVDDFLLET